ncbi:hypothetical protein HNR77_002100 [Paenibacillus sp. JGP012]|uniref:hypothetical protein n=1 Tax=Paenibacillus sp. JGP012 TaxID=2735914 RepID=UPI00160E88C2|nr:hypothetical protein [Paenibacillus sp. JGP012]MBB6021019.1 hypothetical protein [Paenibacillus sp. JGP012]
MSREILEEMHQLSHNDERRYRLLMIGVKQLLHEQKQNRYRWMGRLKERKKLRSVQADRWE